MSVTPALSVIMANRNGGPYLRDALASTLAQTHGDLELILADDASTDDSVSIAREMAARDGRLRILTSDRAGGPAAARNRALSVAGGEWIAVVDSDDLMHPARFERLLARARTLVVDIVADDQVYFGANSGQRLLGALDMSETWRPGAAEYLAAEMTSPAIPVGYLKPILRRSVLGDLRYNEAMPVGEDFDLVFRLLLRGARMAVVPEAYYLYRRHPGSTSHRLTPEACAGMVEACERYAGMAPENLRPLVRERSRMQRRARDFANLVQHLKDRSYLTAAARVLRQPSLSRPLLRAIAERIARNEGAHPAEGADATLRLVNGRGPDGSGNGAEYPVPGDAIAWTPDAVAAFVAKAGRGDVRVRAEGRAGLEALGYLPGWRSAELAPPVNGWTDRERERIAALPWPVALL